MTQGPTEPSGRVKWSLRANCGKKIRKTLRKPLLNFQGYVVYVTKQYNKGEDRQPSESASGNLNAVPNLLKI